MFATDPTVTEEYRRALALVQSERYRTASAHDKREMLWALVSARPFDRLPPLDVSLIENAIQIANLKLMGQAFRSYGAGDVRPPRKKAFHPFGTVAKARFEPIADQPYSGLFASGAPALARLSLARSEAGFSPSVAFKYFVDGKATEQLVLDMSIDEQTSRDFFERTPSNITLWPQRGYLKYVWYVVNWWLSNVADPLHQHLDHLGAVTSDGREVPEEDRLVPYRVRFFAPPPIHTPIDTKTDFREFARKIEPGSLLYEVYATSGPNDNDPLHIANVWTESHFVASAFGDQILSLRHSGGHDDSPTQTFSPAKRPRPLTLIAPLKSQDPRSLADLEGIMAAEGKAIFEGSPSTHFAALVLLGDRKGDKRLFLSADYDGESDAYLDELWSSQPETMQKMFQFCSGFDGRDCFKGFVKQRSYMPQAYFTAFQDESVRNIKGKADVRRRLEQTVGDDPQVVSDFAEAVTDGQGKASPAERLLAALRGIFAKIESILHGALWNTLIWLAMRLMLWLTAGKPSRSASANIGQKLDRELDIRYQKVQAGQVQNQMANISWVLPHRRLIIRLGLFAVNLAARYAYPPGDLAGVKSVHFARWVLIDDDTGLLFEGNFDGTWENYMGEFVDRIAWGLDAIWGNTEGYPPAGMRDIWAFKRYISDLQYPPAMVYMAYPDISVENTMRDRQIYETLRSRQPGSVEKAIGLL